MHSEKSSKREYLDDFVNCYFGRSGSGVSPLAAGLDKKRRDAASTSRHDRQETERFKAFDYEDLIKRDKINLDMLTHAFPCIRDCVPALSAVCLVRSLRARLWLKDDALEESANLPAPGVIAQDIMEDLQAALEQFATIAEDLKIEV
jgi:type I restriction enzyme M protein